MITLSPNKQINYVSSGIFKSDGPWQHPRTTTDTYEIILMYDGIAYICEGEAEYTLQKNDILILEPGTEHYGFKISNEYVSFSWLHYRTTISEYQCISKHFTAANPHALKTLFSQCLHTANTPGYNPICADLYTALYLEEILCNHKVSKETQNQLAAQIKEYVRLNIEKDISVKSIADHFGYHENHISKIFKSTYGVILKKYISEQKIEYIRALLSTTLYTVSRIAQTASFKSENHLIKFFKYHTGLTPSEYRNTYINTYTNKK